MCGKWKKALSQAAPRIRIRRNYPYAGKDDGFMPYLRNKYRPSACVGIELEINQAIVVGTRNRWDELRTAVVESLQAVLASA